MVRHKFILHDNPLRQAELQECETPEAIREMTPNLGISSVKADLRRIKGQKALARTDQELETWLETP